MKILENEIASTEPFGMIDGKEVKLVRTKGGLNLATMGNEVLGAASHQAILCYSIEQRYPKFQPMIMKSEGLKLAAESHSHFLTDDLRKSGHDIFSVQNGDVVDFYITKQSIKIGMAKGSLDSDKLVINSIDAPKEFLPGLSGAVAEKVLSSGLKGMKVK
jgi:hypothetical protein